MKVVTVHKVFVSVVGLADIGFCCCCYGWVDGCYVL